MPAQLTDSIIKENLRVATEYFKATVANFEKKQLDPLKKEDSGGATGFIPFKIHFTMDGLSGIKIYNELKANTSFLPTGYTKTTKFIITGVEHKISNGDWETSINTTLIPNPSAIDIITADIVISPRESYIPLPPVNNDPNETPPNEEGNNTSPIINTSSTEKKHIVIGDSQTPSISSNNSKAKVISETQGESSLWQVGKDVSWLRDAVEKYPVSNDVKTVVINIGTNGVFNLKDDVKGLINAIKTTFPNAKLLAVKGSWGWSKYNKDVAENDVNTYYEKFSSLGVIVLKTPIGKTTNHPGPNTPSFKRIGKEIEAQII